MKIIFIIFLLPIAYTFPDPEVKPHYSGLGDEGHMKPWDRLTDQERVALAEFALGV